MGAQAWTVIMVVLIILTLGDAKEDLDNMNMKEMMMEMKEINLKINQYLSLSEKILTMGNHELADTRDDLVSSLTGLAVTKESVVTTKDALDVALTDLAITKNDLDNMKKDLASTKKDLATTKNDLDATKHDLATIKNDFATTKQDLITKAQELEREVTILRYPPFLHSCGYQMNNRLKSKTITYESLLYNSTNIEGGGLDLETGVFVSPHPGTYTVSWSLHAADGLRDNFVFIYLSKGRLLITCMVTFGNSSKQEETNRN